ncbi:RNA pseudouridine synthase [Thermaurantimonas aggregans]|uniref:RNA pseudouridine synthase n=1 Tax=Thermaurantimonas aggregans TaxID=2173829 RepID=A0A401XMG4_9FLAO|nr:RluA family pseudouridine synthase [Thermaurantimonas aggregans]MCX8148389.1 RluA family pseudouridine synthase [Thermaurantimonas aggregans]GCD78192.1 RNA pseudouridine synthase [Thermaurantimonas aggregans]
MPSILFENPQYFIVDKEHGLNSEPDRHDHANLMDWLKRQRPDIYKRWGPHPLHRLDRPVAGLLIVAKNLRAHRTLQRLFENRRITKMYRALVQGLVHPSEGELHHYHIKDPKNFKAIISENPAQGALLVGLSYRVIRHFNEITELDLRLHTGRYHQIRAQLAFIGHPILGDVLYGSTQMTLNNVIALRAYKLGFYCPFEKRKMVFEYLPSEFYESWSFKPCL